MFNEFYGGISFAIIEDRKFKSAPKQMLPEAKINNGWSEPKHLGYTINTERYEQQPSVSSSGTLYYVGYWDGGKNNYGIYKSVFTNGSYSLPELLPESINI